MSDINCAKCHEPWDSYGISAAKRGEGDMTAAEAEKFLRGKGCPCCGFGTICTMCNGTGREQAGMTGWCDECQVCHGRRRLNVRRLVSVDPYRFSRASKTTGIWFYGYDPNSCEVPVDLAGKVFDKRRFQCLEGLAEEAWTFCWKCHETAPVCTACKGSGKFQPDPERDNEDLFEVARECLGDDLDGLVCELEDLS